MEQVWVGEDTVIIRFPLSLKLSSACCDRVAVSILVFQIKTCKSVLVFEKPAEHAFVFSVNISRTIISTPRKNKTLSPKHACDQLLNCLLHYEQQL